MNALVELRHEVPVTTSLAVAEGTENEHRAVIQLVRRYADDLADFGPLAFETRMGSSLPQGGFAKATEFAILNEPQATLLITYMKNSEVVRTFKKRLVAAFFALRDQQRAGVTPRRDDPLSTAHRADILVSADRSFRAAIRSGRAAGMGTAAAIRRARAIALDRTGIDLLAELALPEPQDPPPPAPAPPPAWEVALDAWCAANPGPVKLDDVADATGWVRQHWRPLAKLADALRARGYTSRKVREHDARGRERQGMRWRRATHLAVTPLNGEMA